MWDTLFFLKYNFDVFAINPVSYGGGKIGGGGDKIRMIYGFLGNNKRKDMDRRSFKY